MAKKKKSTTGSIEEQLIKFGCDVVTTVDDIRPSVSMSTGLKSLDRIVAGGPIPFDCCVHLYGPSNCGKSSLCLHLTKQAIDNGIKVYYFDTEHAINDKILACFGLDPEHENFTIIQPENGEAAIDGISLVLSSLQNVFVVNDSIASCVPSVIDESMAGENPALGAVARLFARAMPKFKKCCKKNENLLVQVNHVKKKIGPMARGNTTPGGVAIPYHSDLWIELKRSYTGSSADDITFKGKTIGHKVEAKATRSRFTTPDQCAKLPLIYGSGFDVGIELFDECLQWGLATQAASWYTLYRQTTNDDGEEVQEEVCKSQGIADCAQYIRDNADYREHVNTIIDQYYDI